MKELLAIIYLAFVGSGVGISALQDASQQDILSRLRRTSERDPYVFNLFEVILTTLETKLRRVENMDKAIEHLVKRIDAMEGQLSLTINTTSKIVHLLDVRLDSGCFGAAETIEAPKQVTRVVRHRPYTGFFFDGLPEKRKTPTNTVLRGPTSGVGQRGPTARRVSTARNLDALPPFNNELIRNTSDGKMEKQLDEVVKRVAMIDSKLSTLQEQLDTNIIVKQTEELMASASESYRIGLGLGDRLQAVEKKQDLGNLEATVEDLRNSLDSIDRRLQINTETSEQGLLQLSDDMNGLKTAVDNLRAERNGDWCCAKANVSADLTQECVSPFQEINDKSDKILSSMVTRVDLQGLEPKSLQEEQILQGKVLEDLRKQMDDNSSKLMKNLQEVRKDLRRVRMVERDGSGTGINPVALLQRTTGTGAPDNAADALSPPSDILDQRILSQRNESAAESNGDRTRHAGVIFPQKHKKPVESAFLASSHEAEIQGYSCLDLLKKGQKKSGTYHLKIRGTTYWFLQVYCDMTTAGGGWTVIQRRDDFGDPKENFNRGWADYKHGFGHPEKELWLGNENIYMLTNTDDYVLRVDLEDFDGSKRFAEYTTFKLHDETDLYKLEIGGYNGSAGDALNDPWYGSNLSPFSTFDRDNDRSSLNCASMLKGGWWWRSCGRGLNGLYLTNPNDFTARQGIVWFRWRGWDYTLKRTVLMIRPKAVDEKGGAS